LEKLDGWELTDISAALESLTTCTLYQKSQEQKMTMVQQRIGAIRWNDYEDGVEVKNEKDVEVGDDGEEKAPCI